MDENFDQGQNQFSIPEEYQDNQDISSATSVSDLCKTIVNQQKLIGQKYVGIPNENSTQEEIAKYREAIGVPVKFEDYSIEASEEVKKMFGDDKDELTTEFKKLMFDAGLSQKQAQQMRTGYDGIMVRLKNEIDENNKALDTEFENLITEKFGSAKEEKVNIAKGFIQQYVSENVKEYLPSVINDNKALLVIADIANNIYPDLKGEDIRDIGKMSGIGKTEPELRAEMQKIIASEAFQNDRHLGHTDAMTKFENIAKQIASLKNKS